MKTSESILVVCMTANIISIIGVSAGIKITSSNQLTTASAYGISHGNYVTFLYDQHNRSVDIEL